MFFAWFRTEAVRAQKLRDFIRRVDDGDVNIELGFRRRSEYSWVPDQWLVFMFGREAILTIAKVSCAAGGTTDDDLLAIHNCDDVVRRDIVVCDLPCEFSSDEITDRGVTYLERLRNLTSLRLDYTRVGDEAMEAISRFSQLEELSLSETNVTDAGIMHLPALTRLRSLDLRNNNDVTDKSSAYIAELRNLEHLDVSYTQMRERSLAELSQLPALRSLAFSFMFIHDNGIQHLSKFPALKSLDMSQNWMMVPNDRIRFDIASAPIVNVEELIVAQHDLADLESLRAVMPRAAVRIVDSVSGATVRRFPAPNHCTPAETTDNAR